MVRFRSATPPPRSGAALETASAGSANSGARESYEGGSSTVNTRSPITVAAWPSPPDHVNTEDPESRAIQLASTSCAVTGEPSQNRASSRSVKVQRRPASSALQERANPGTIRPSQSTCRRVSYSCGNTRRSASLRGTGAWAGSTGSVRPMVTVSRADVGAAATAQFVPGGAPPGTGTAARGVVGRQAASSAATSIWRYDGLTGADPTEIRIV